MKKTFFIAVATTCLFASCSSVSNVAPSLEYMESSARVLEAEHNMLLTPVIADLEVSDKKISYTEKEMFANMDVTYALLQNIGELKNIALSRAARANNADVLVGTTIDVVTKNERLEITVTGFPAKYVKFRNANEKDVELLNNLHKDGGNGLNDVKVSSAKLDIKAAE